jgi:hypothetical protein
MEVMAGPSGLHRRDRPRVVRLLRDLWDLLVVEIPVSKLGESDDLLDPLV